VQETQRRQAASTPIGVRSAYETTPELARAAGNKGATTRWLTRKTYPIAQDTQPVKIDGRVDASPNGGHHIRNKLHRRELDRIDELSYQVLILADGQKHIPKRVYAQSKWRRLGSRIFGCQVVYTVPTTPKSTTQELFTGTFILLRATPDPRVFV